MISDKLSHTTYCVFNSIPDILQAGPHAIQVHQIHRSVEAVAVMVHRVWHCGVSFYQVLAYETACSGIISSCLCKIQSSCAVHLIPCKAEALHGVLEDIFSSPYVIAEFIKSIDFLTSPCPVCQAHRASKVILEIEVVSSFFLHPCDISIPEISFPSVLCPASDASHARRSLQKVMVLVGQIQGVADDPVRDCAACSCYALSHPVTQSVVLAGCLLHPSVFHFHGTFHLVRCIKAVCP